MLFRHGVICLIMSVTFGTFLYGCQSSTDTMSILPQTTSSITSTTPSSPAPEDKSTSSVFQATPAPTNSLHTFDNSIFPSTINNLYNAHDGKILVYSDCLYLYDPFSGSILSQYNVGTPNSLMCFLLDNGYAVISNTFSPTSESDHDISCASKIICTFLTESLEPISEIDLSPYFAGTDILLTADITSDGNTIALAGVKGLYFFQTELDKYTHIPISDMRVTGPTPTVFTSIQFGTNDSELLFTAATVDGPNALGKVTLPDQTVHTIFPKHYAIGDKILPFKNKYAVIEDFTQTTGRLLILDPHNMEVSYFPFSSSDEGADGVCLSDSGSYIVTASLESSGVLMRIYCTDTQSLLHEEHITSEDSSLFSHVPYFILVESSRMCFLLARGGSNAQVFSFSF